MRQINDEWTNYHAERVRRSLLRQHPNAQIDPYYTCGTVEGDSLLTLQISIDLGEKRPPSRIHTFIAKTVRTVTHWWWGFR